MEIVNKTFNKAFTDTIFKYVLSIWCMFGISTVLAQDPVANLPQGRIVGIKAYTEGSITPVEIYYGVPYAMPPKGRYRFAAPERHTGWRRTFFAHRIPPHCPHVGDGDSDNYSEDCLFLNIWTPRNFTWSRTMQPISDTFLPESEQFLPKSLVAALSVASQTQPSVKLDVLIGTSDLEALNYNDEKYAEITKQGNLNMSEYANIKIIPENLRLFSLDRSEAIPILTQAVRWEYWNDKTRNTKDLLTNIEYLGRVESSVKWSAGIALIAARLARKVARLYVYRFSQPAGVDLKGRKYNFTGAVHGSDLVSLFGDPLMLQVARRPATEDEKRVSLLLRKHIINFIQFGSPAEETVWQRYKIGDANIYDIRDVENTNTATYHSADRDVQFWLQYLPHLYNLLDFEKTEQLIDQKGEYRLRGGVFAMSGVVIVLLLLLFVCVMLLHRQQSRQFTVSDDNHH